MEHEGTLPTVLKLTDTPAYMLDLMNEDNDKDNETSA